MKYFPITNIATAMTQGGSLIAILLIKKLPIVKVFSNAAETVGSLTRSYMPQGKKSEEIAKLFLKAPDKGNNSGLHTPEKRGRPKLMASS